MKKITLLICLSFVLSTSVVFAEWHVAGASIRAVVVLKGRPSHPSAGHVAIIPDGGILPGSKVDIVTEAGAKLKSALLWHSRANGLVVVFGGARGGDKVYAYISEGMSPIWTPASGLTPSPYCATDSSVGNMRRAKALATLGPVDSVIHFERSYPFPKYGYDYLIGDFSGRQYPNSVYGLTYLDIKEAGKVFFGSILGAGSTAEVRINGKVMVEKKVHPASGGKGDYIELTKGLHLCEVFLYSVKLPEDRKKLYMKSSGWQVLRTKLPSEKYEDMAGVWGDNPPGKRKTGEAKKASRPVDSSEIVKSGKSKVMYFESKTGIPVANFSVEAMACCYVAKRTPSAIVYQLKAQTESNPEDTVYTWRFPEGAQDEGVSVVQLWEGFKDYNVMLTAQSKAGKSTCVIPVYARTGLRSSLESPEYRSVFRSAFLSTIRSLPPDKDVTAMWTTNMWVCFHGSLEVGKGEVLLSEIVTKQWDKAKTRMTKYEQDMLKANFFQFLSRFNPAKALVWLKNEKKSTQNMDQRKLLQIWMAEVYMYQLDDFEKAKELLNEVASSGRAASETSALAKIRLGDVAFLERDVNMANEYWGSVQNKVDVSKSLFSNKPDGNTADGNTAKLSGGLRKPKSRAEKEADQKAAAAAAKKKQKDKGGFSTAITSGSSGVEDWKRAAVIDTTMATEVISLMEQGFWYEAYVNLRIWERACPLSKIAGDFIIRDAKYYEQAGDRKRARALLTAYCDNVDASAFLANAVGDLLSLMVKAGDDEKVVEAFCKVMKKQFEFHPLAERLSAMLDIYGADGVKREFIKVDF